MVPECLERFYKDLLFCLLQNGQKIRNIVLYAAIHYPDSSDSVLVYPVLQLQTQDYPKFLQLISHLDYLKTIGIIGDNVNIFRRDTSQDRSGTVKNLKGLYLLRTFNRPCDLRQVLLELCTNLQELSLCVDLARLNLTTFEGDHVSSRPIDLEYVIRSKVRQIF
jgi:hypothetical protein